jgi:xylulokinase
MSGFVIGVDLATAQVRAVALDLDTGLLHAVRSAPLPGPVRGPGGSSEQDADYAAAALDVIGAVAADLGTAAAGIRAVSVTGTSGTVVPCGRDGHPVGAAVLYDDRRADAQRSVLREAGADPATTSALARIGWLGAHRPAARYLATVDVVLAGLGGPGLPGDTSHHLKSGIDPAAATWPADLLAALHIDPAAVPDLVHPGVSIGAVRPAVAAELALPAGVTLVSGMTDGCTGQIAAGAVRPGDTVGVLGTTLVLKAVTDRAVADPSGAVYSHYAPDGRWWAGGASNAGAGVLAAEYGDADLARLDHAAELHGPAHALRYPLAGNGERFPIADPEMRAFSVGAAGGSIDGYRALLDGVAFTERCGLELLSALGVPPGRHRLAGGATRSRVWNRIRATALGVPVLIPANPISALGAALLAASAVRREGLVSTVRALLQPAVEVGPDPATLAELDQRYRAWCKALAAATRQAIQL